MTADRPARWNRLGIRMPSILLPRADCIARWPVVACDQHVDDPAYWIRRRDAVGEAISSLHLVVPECDLPISDLARRAAAIAHTMRIYLDRQDLEPVRHGVVRVRRTFPDGRIRDALVACVDLERCLDPDPSRGLVRPTEDTVANRIPVRLAVRRLAPLELPHLQVVFDDPELSAIEAIDPDDLEPVALYDLELPEGGGRLEGRRLRDDGSVLEAFERLWARSGGRLWWVGDGNHSFQAALAHWRELRSRGVSPEHPARWVLCELLNLRSPGLEIHPVHRILRTDRPHRLPDLARAVLGSHPEGPVEMLGAVTSERLGDPSCTSTESVLRFDELVDRFSGIDPGLRLEYEHGGDAARSKAGPGVFAFVLPPPTVDGILEAIEGGVLPRKTFSLGTAMEKRHYMEARRIA